jgi:hypothetical protein
VIDPLAVDVVVSIAALVAPAVFLATLAVAGRRRSRGLPVGPRLTTFVTFLGGSCLGLLLLMSESLVLSWPILAATVVLWLVLMQRGAWRLAGWFVGGAAAPWTVVSGLFLVRLVPSPDPLRLWQPSLGFFMAAGLLLLSLATAVIKRAPAVDAAVAAANAPPTGRRFGDVGAAVRAPAIVGPFGVSEVALLAALVGTWILAGILLPASIPEPVRLGILVVLGAVIGAEAFIRAMPRPAREGFEAFSWLGEWELAQARALTGRAVPTNEVAARRWLIVVRDRPELRGLRVEILGLAKRFDEARALAEQMPESTTQERFDRAVAIDFAGWFAGGDGDVAALEAAAAELLPRDGDARLRGEIAIALAKVRRGMAAGDDPIVAGEPLREVRRRLGQRADGQVGRAFRGRLVRSLVIVGVAFAVMSLLLPDLSPGI